MISNVNSGRSRISQTGASPTQGANRLFLLTLQKQMHQVKFIGTNRIPCSGRSKEAPPGNTASATAVNVTVVSYVIYYWPHRSCGQGYVFTRVCDSVNRGGLPQCMLGYHAPWEQTPTTPTPPEHTPPRTDTTPGAYTPPSEADSGIRSMSGRYASYWNAFLLNIHVDRLKWKRNEQYSTFSTKIKDYCFHVVWPKILWCVSA